MEKGLQRCLNFKEKGDGLEDGAAIVGAFPAVACLFTEAPAHTSFMEG